MSALEDHLRQRIRTEGPLSFRDYMDEVLYHPQFGYYCSPKTRIGRSGDFYTSSDLDPVFGKLLASYFEKLSRGYDEFCLVELGAGKGLLARDILSEHVFPYRILERSPAMRRQQQSLLAGLSVEWIDELPDALTGCILSNEFFDALPVHRFVGRHGEIREIFVDENFREIEETPRVRTDFQLEEGQVVDISLEAREWIRRISKSLKRGYHFAIDYGYLRNEFFARRSGTLMCYFRHQVHDNPYIHIGDQDITAHVNFSDLIEEGEECGMELEGCFDQKDFLINLGLLDVMQELAFAGDARSIERLLRIKNLILPDRMGERFKVLIQRKRDLAP